MNSQRLRERPAATTHNRKIGLWGEGIAADLLEKKGYEILERNVRTPFGEIDLVCKLDGMIIFTEVKTRTNTELGFPESGLTKRKSNHLIQACEEYLMNHPELPGDWSVDLIAILGKPGISSPEIIHFENVAHGE